VPATMFALSATTPSKSIFVGSSTVQRAMCDPFRQKRSSLKICRV
jgi:hypothetical protein